LTNTAPEAYDKCPHLVSLSSSAYGLQLLVHKATAVIASVSINILWKDFNIVSFLTPC